MATSTTPITPELFATALKDLPLDTLHHKAAELQNSIAHLLSSNSQLQPFADEGDEDCKQAIAENEVVVERMKERIELCRAEAEGRGLPWVMGAAKENGEGTVNGSTQPSGTVTDEELRRRVEESLGEGEGDADDGVHL